MKMPILAAQGSEQNPPVVVRRLTDAEFEYDRSARPMVFEAASRFKLFRILALNYQEWTSYQRSLMSPGFNDPSFHITLDRLLFNFLATAYGLTEHFEMSYRQRHKKNQKMLERYNTFFTQMCERTWAVAFFMDFRDYVQHCALPIGRIHRNEYSHGISIAITHNAADLARHSRIWRRSKLSAERGELDLITLTTEYYQVLTHVYGNFMAEAFFPELKDAHAFYARLTCEVHQRHPTDQMVFVTGAEMKTANVLASLEVTITHPPNDVFGELGIKIEK